MSKHKADDAGNPAGSTLKRPRVGGIPLKDDLLPPGVPTAPAWDESNKLHPHVRHVHHDQRVMSSPMKAGSQAALLRALSPASARATPPRAQLASPAARRTSPSAAAAIGAPSSPLRRPAGPHQVPHSPARAAPHPALPSTPPRGGDLLSRLHDKAQAQRLAASPSLKAAAAPVTAFSPAIAALAALDGAAGDEPGCAVCGSAGDEERLRHKCVACARRYHTYCAPAGHEGADADNDAEQGEWRCADCVRAAKGAAAGETVVTGGNGKDAPAAPVTVVVSPASAEPAAEDETAADSAADKAQSGDEAKA